jgi:ADP-heptose:LPS heptosyltransferase
VAVVAMRPLGLGGFLTAVPALRALQDAYPAEGVVVAAPRTLWPLAALAGVDLAGARPYEPLDPALRRATLLVNLHDRGPESTRIALAAAPRRLIAFAHSAVPETAGMPLWERGENDTDRWCRLLSECGIPADPSRRRLPAPDLDIEPFARGATVIHPATGTADGAHAAERFAEHARAELAAGREVVITGGPGEVGLANEIARRVHLRPGAVMAGRTDLLRLAALVAHAGKVITADSGVGHLARAFDTPAVVLFGRTQPVRALANAS